MADWKEELRRASVDVDGAISSFANKEERYVKYLKLFRADDNFKNLKQAIDNEDCKTAFECCHTLKGIVGNLCIRGMFKNIYDACEILRTGEMNGVRELIEEISPNYDAVIGIIDDNLM